MDQMIQALPNESHSAPYIDRKRPAWLLSILVPASVCIGPLLYFLTGAAWTVWVPLVFYYAFIPLADYLLGGDRSNPPESRVPQLETDLYYRYVTYALVPVLWGAFLFACWFVGTTELPWHAVLGVALTTGQVCGFGLNLAHELGHKKTGLEKRLAQITLALGAYGHFTIEHNQGHHKAVATPEDPASARMGESLWRFLLREMPGGLKRAWAIEAQRLARTGLGPWHGQNTILQTLLISLSLYTVLLLSFGWIMLPFLAITLFWGAFQLTCANYVEHYGLLRGMENGRYERCQPHHSWNSNHVFSNWALFHLQRHSDHHANPARRYQSLRHFEDVPQLPSGYTGMFLLAYIPRLWYSIMDKRLLDWTGRDVEKLNLDPVNRARLIRRYGLRTTGE